MAPLSETEQEQDGKPAVISVIVPHLNQPQMLARCLASLAAGVRVPDEIIVVDNGSARNTGIPLVFLCKYGEGFPV